MPTTLVATAAPTDTRIADVDTWDGIAVTAEVYPADLLLVGGAMLARPHRKALENMLVTAPVVDGAFDGDALIEAAREMIDGTPMVAFTWDNETLTGSIYLGSRKIGTLAGREASRFECGHVDTDGWARRCGADLSADCQKCATAHEHGCPACA